MSDDRICRDRQFAASAERNAGPILEVLRGVFGGSGTLLEIASGTGQHVVKFAKAFPGAIWQPSDADPAARRSIAAWIAYAGVANVRPPMFVDVTTDDWERRLPRPVAGALDGIVCINLLHISPWAACEGLMRGAGHLLPPESALVVYGAFKRDGRHTAPSNAAFDRALKDRDPEWGVRDLEAVEECARGRGLRLDASVPMPSNNFSVVFRRRQPVAPSRDRTAG